MRQEAMEWWNSLHGIEKETYCSLCYSERNPISLTGREIEEMYKCFFK